MTEIQEAMRVYFEALTEDSRPMRPGCCPMVAAGLARDNADATTRSPELVRQLDAYTRDKHGALQWHRLTAWEVLFAMGYEV